MPDFVCIMIKYCPELKPDALMKSPLRPDGSFFTKRPVGSNILIFSTISPGDVRKNPSIPGLGNSENFPSASFISPEETDTEPY